MAINYRAAGRGRSHREFTAKMGTASEEADESYGWLELIDDLGIAPGPELQWLLGESAELMAIYGSAYHTAKRNDVRERERKQRP